MSSLSNWSIALNSIYVIVASLLGLPSFSKYSGLTPESLCLITIFLSIIIIVVSLIENSKNYVARAMNLHQCGKDLSQLYERLEQIKGEYLTSNLIKTEVDNLGIKYQEIINQYSENHLTTDYEYFKAYNNLYLNGLTNTYNRIKFHFRFYSMYYLSMALSPILFFVFCFKW